MNTIEIYLMKKYIKKKASKQEVNIKKIKPDITQLNEYLNIQIKEVCAGRIITNPVIFSWMPKRALPVLSACCFCNTIYLNAEWAAHLVLNQNVTTKRAFATSIGHELTHLDGDYKDGHKIILGRRNRKFVSWVMEVHADFGSAQKMTDCSREVLLAGMRYKKKTKEQRYKDRDDITHPSWERRLFYASHYDFDKTLIRRIAKDTGCRKETLISDVTAFYEPICLSPEPIQIKETSD